MEGQSKDSLVVPSGRDYVEGWSAFVIVFPASPRCLWRCSQVSEENVDVDDGALKCHCMRSVLQNIAYKISWFCYIMWWDTRENVLARRRDLMRSDSAKRWAGNRNCLTSWCGSVSLRLDWRTERGNFMPKNVCCSSALRVWSSRWNNTPSSQRTRLKKMYEVMTQLFTKS